MAKYNNKYHFLTWPDIESLSTAAAHYFVTSCHREIAKKGFFTVALSGGNTPRLFYQLLASKNFSNNIPWDKIFLFWSDERFVDYSDNDSNYRMVKETLLDHIDIPENNIYPCIIKETAELSASKYEKRIRKFFGDKKPKFDWIMLGLGSDGHTASLFPGTPVLKEKKKMVAEVWADEKKSWRITFTIPVLNNAKELVFLVSGKEKQSVLSAIYAGKKDAFPVQKIRPKGSCWWFIDQPLQPPLQPV